MSLPPPLQQVRRTWVRFRGRTLSYFAGCDYFRLASHPRVLNALDKGLRQYGLSVSASRVTTGNHRLYEELESTLASFFGAESATLASNGYAPNLMAAQALAGQFSHALMDERAHGCLADAALLLDCPVLKFKHRDPADLSQRLHRLGRVRPILLTDGMFAHDGSVAPLGEYLRLLPPGAALLVDDAHGAGVLGENGRGTPEHGRISSKRMIQTITLSKAFGVFGGAVLASREIRAKILARSRVFIGSTPLPLPLAYAAIKSAALVKTGGAMRTRLKKNADYVKARLRAGGYSFPEAPGPIIPVICRNSKAAGQLKLRLLAHDIHPPFINYPGGPSNGYFRFVISSEHTQKQLDNLVAALLMKRLWL